GARQGVSAVALVWRSAGATIPHSAHLPPHIWEGATLVASATRVAAACWPVMPCPAHHGSASPVLFRRRAGRAADSLQPLEEKALRASPAGWHRFCLLLE